MSKTFNPKMETQDMSYQTYRNQIRTTFPKIPITSRKKEEEKINPPSQENKRKFTRQEATVRNM